jgi:hypothetical protein
MFVGLLTYEYLLAEVSYYAVSGKGKECIQTLIELSSAVWD